MAPYVGAPEIKARRLVLTVEYHGQIGNPGQDTAVDKDGLRDTWNWINQDYTLVTMPNHGHWIQNEAADMVSTTMEWWLKARP